MGGHNRLYPSSPSPLSPLSPEKMWQRYHGLASRQRWKQASAPPGFSAEHWNKSKNRKNKEGVQLWGRGAKGNEEGALQCLKAPKIKRRTRFQWTTFHCNGIGGESPPRRPCPCPFPSCRGAGRSVLPPPRPQRLGGVGRGWWDQSPPQFLSWEKKRRHQYPNEVLVRVNFSARISNQDERLGTAAAGVLQLLGASAWAIVELARLASCWKPRGFVRRARGCVTYVHIAQLPSHRISSEQGIHLAGTAANLAISTKLKKRESEVAKLVLLNTFFFVKFCVVLEMWGVILDMRLSRMQCWCSQPLVYKLNKIDVFIHMN